MRFKTSRNRARNRRRQLCGIFDEEPSSEQEIDFDKVKNKKDAYSNQNLL